MEGREQRTKIKRCDCRHNSQDVMYGKHLRLFNAMDRSEKSWRCTVCGKEVTE